MRSFSAALSTAVAAALLAGCAGSSTGSSLSPPNPVAGDQIRGVGRGFPDPIPKPQKPPKKMISGCLLFPNPDSFYAPYTTNISNYPVNSNSANYMARYRTILHANFGYAPNTGFPINVVPRNQPLVPVSFTKYANESDPGPYPIPNNARLEGENGGSDRHLIVLQEGTCNDYEIFQAAHSRRSRVDRGQRSEI